MIICREIHEYHWQWGKNGRVNGLVCSRNPNPVYSLSHRCLNSTSLKSRVHAWLHSWHCCAFGCSWSVPPLHQILRNVLYVKKSPPRWHGWFSCDNTLCVPVANKSIRRIAADLPPLFCFLKAQALSRGLGSFFVSKMEREGSAVACSWLRADQNMSHCVVMSLSCSWLGCLLKGSNGSFAFYGVHNLQLQHFALNDMIWLFFFCFKSCDGGPSIPFLKPVLAMNFHTEMLPDTLVWKDRQPRGTLVRPCK